MVGKFMSMNVGLGQTAGYEQKKRTGGGVGSIAIAGLAGLGVAGGRILLG